MRLLEQAREAVLRLEARTPVGVVERVLGQDDDDLDLLGEPLEPLLGVQEGEAVREEVLRSYQPAPMPQSTSKRPPEMWSTVTAIRARTLG